MEEKSERNQKIIALRSEGKTYEELANIFGVSRQRIQQITGDTGLFSDIIIKNLGKTKQSAVDISSTTGLSIATVYKKFGNFRLGINDKGGSVYKGKKYEKTVSGKLSSMGIENQLMPNSHPFDILLANGKRIDVKGTSHKMQPASQKTPYYHFKIGSNKKIQETDFFILYIEPDDAYYIFPGNMFPSGHARIYHPPLYKSKFSFYLNNFSLLTK